MFYRIKKDDKLFCMKLEGLWANDIIELFKKNDYNISPITEEQALRLIAALEVINGAEIETADDYVKELPISLTQG